MFFPYKNLPYLKGPRSKEDLYLVNVPYMTLKRIRTLKFLQKIMFTLFAFRWVIFSPFIWYALKYILFQGTYGMDDLEKHHIIDWIFFISEAKTYLYLRELRLIEFFDYWENHILEPIVWTLLYVQKTVSSFDYAQLLVDHPFLNMPLPIEDFLTLKYNLLPFYYESIGILFLDANTGFFGPIFFYLAALFTYKVVYNSTLFGEGYSVNLDYFYRYWRERLYNVFYAIKNKGTLMHPLFQWHKYAFSYFTFTIVIHFFDAQSIRSETYELFKHSLAKTLRIMPWSTNIRDHVLAKKYINLLKPRHQFFYKYLYRPQKIELFKNLTFPHLSIYNLEPMALTSITFRVSGIILLCLFLLANLISSQTYFFIDFFEIYAKYFEIKNWYIIISTNFWWYWEKEFNVFRFEPWDNSLVLLEQLAGYYNDYIIYYNIKSISDKFCLEGLYKGTSGIFPIIDRIFYQEFGSFFNFVDIFYNYVLDVFTYFVTPRFIDDINVEEFLRYLFSGYTSIYFLLKNFYYDHILLSHFSTFGGLPWLYIYCFATLVLIMFFVAHTVHAITHFLLDCGFGMEYIRRTGYFYYLVEAFSFFIILCPFGMTTGVSTILKKNVYYSHLFVNLDFYTVLTLLMFTLWFFANVITNFFGRGNYFEDPMGDEDSWNEHSYL